MDYRTVKKYYQGYRGKSSTREKRSVLDEYKEEIGEKLSIPGARYKSVYQYFKRKYGELGKYHNFVKYAKRHELKPNKTAKQVHPRFETSYGKQLQFDWKEDMKLNNRKGEVFEFNVLSATLSASRLHIFIYSKYKTREDTIRCLVEVFERLGGVTEEALTDNMSSIFNIRQKRFVPEFISFCKDFSIEAKHCRVNSPQTKGKDESANRLLNWLIPYNGEFDTEEELIDILAKITIDVNNEVNGTTGVPPSLLYSKEKEYLRPLPNKRIRDSYLLRDKQVVVGSDFLVYYQGSRYSVDPKFIGKKLTIKEQDHKLHLYNNNKLIAIHKLNQRVINYIPEHYFAGLRATMPYKTEEELVELAENNLALFDDLLKEKGNQHEDI